eukprot:14778448-Alexandrium_andersonii.AAC.1
MSRHALHQKRGRQPPFTWRLNLPGPMLAESVMLVQMRAGPEPPSLHPTLRGCRPRCRSRRSAHR